MDITYFYKIPVTKSNMLNPITIITVTYDILE